MRTLSKLVARFLLATALLASLMVLSPGAGPAGAATLLSCTGTESVTYSPPVTATPQSTTIDVNGNLPVCLLGGGITSVRYQENITNTVSCLNLLGSGTGTRVFTYNDNSTSTFGYNKTVTTVGGNNIITFTGTILAGRYAGATAEEVITQVALNPLCLGGVGSTVGAVTLAILSV